MARRAAILINCSATEAAKLHKESEEQRRTVSGYILTILMRSVSLDEGVAAHLGAHRASRLTVWKRSIPLPGPRTRVLLRCSQEESSRIRAAAKRREITLSGYILHCLQRAWKVQAVVGPMSQILGIENALKTNSATVRGRQAR